MSLIFKFNLIKIISVTFILNIITIIILISIQINLKFTEYLCFDYYSNNYFNFKYDFI